MAFLEDLARSSRARVALALSWAATALALAVPADRLRETLWSLSSSGRSYFLDEPTARVLHGGLLSAGPAVLLVLAVARRLPAAGPAGAPAAPSRAFHLLQALLIAGVLATGLARLANDPPATTDTKYYLTESLAIAESGGLLALPARCFRGEYLEENRHPLYPGLLSVVAERSDRFTDRARLFSLAGALVALALASSWMASVHGEAGGIVGGALLATNGVFLEQSRLVACESWLMALAVPWFAACARSGPPRARPFALAGACAALLWLTKGTGTLYVAAALVALFHVDGSRALRPAAAFLAVFAAVAVPLLWRNVVVFDNPFHNINSSRVFWLDHWSEFHDAERLHSAGPAEWWRENGFTGAVARLAVGGAKQAIHLLEVLSPIRAGWGLGLPVLALAVLLALRDPARRRRVLWFVLVGLFFVAFSWYAKVVQGPRFLAALAPILLLPLARLGPAFLDTPARLAALRAGAAGVALAMVGAGVADGALSYRPDRFRETEATERVHAFLREHVGERYDVHYLMGPSDHLTLDWDDAVRGERYSFPETWEGYAALLRSNDGPGLRYAFVEPGRGSDRIDRDWVRRGPGGFVAAPPEGWRLVTPWPEEEPAALVFERQDPRAGL